MKTPEVIYLVDQEDTISWCEEPTPGEGMKEEDATQYVRADTLKTMFIKCDVCGREVPY